jgi:hypothetical protein
MIATSDRRPGSVGAYQAVKGVAPEQGARGRLIPPFEPHYRAYGLFERRRIVGTPSRGVGPLGVLFSAGGAMKGLSCHGLYPGTPQRDGRNYRPRL